METPSPAFMAVPRVDTHLSKFSQGGTVALTGLAFLTAQPVIVLIAAVILLLSVLLPVASPFRLLYQGVVLPLRLWRPRGTEDHPAPHHLPQGIRPPLLDPRSLVLFLHETAHPVAV